MANNYSEEGKANQMAAVQRAVETNRKLREAKAKAEGREMVTNVRGLSRREREYLEWEREVRRAGDIGAEEVAIAGYVKAPKNVKLNAGSIALGASSHLRVVNLERFKSLELDVPWMDEEDWEDYDNGVI